MVPELNQKIVSAAEKYIGLREIHGVRHEEQILRWFEAAGATWIKNDEAAWCSAFACGIAKEAGAFNPQTVRAKEWLSIDPSKATRISISDLIPGDVVVVRRGKNLYHVSIFYGVRSNGDLRLLGGNQNNQVSRAYYSRARFVGAVRLSTAS